MIQGTVAGAGGGQLPAGPPANGLDGGLGGLPWPVGTRIGPSRRRAIFDAMRAVFDAVSLPRRADALRLTRAMATDDTGSPGHAWGPLVATGACPAPPEAASWAAI